MKRIILAIIVALATTTATAGDLVREFTGDKSMTTVRFDVESPWILDWRLDADYDQLVALDITLIQARTGRHVGQVLHTKRKGNGVKMFNQSGSFQLRISATLARWRIRIEQLTDEEAKLYTPR